MFHVSIPNTRDKFNKKGFTLIELLVVIAIIGLLSSIVLVSVNTVREKARNSKRLFDIKNYSTVFELAYNENNEYPDPGDTSTYYCLGEYSDSKCQMGGTSMSESATLNGILDDWIDLPAGENLTCNGFIFEGYIYRCLSRPNGICESVYVGWLMEGTDQSCGRGQALFNYGNCTYCEYTVSL